MRRTGARLPVPLSTLTIDRSGLTLMAISVIAMASLVSCSVSIAESRANGVMVPARVSMGPAAR
jgi:hypothetical protein